MELQGSHQASRLPRSPSSSRASTRRSLTDCCAARGRHWLDAGVTSTNVTLVRVPGAFEIPLAARRLARSGRYDAVVCLGCLIKGDTMHFEYIASAVSHGIMAVSADTGVPVTFGVLTTLTEEQAVARAARWTRQQGARSGAGGAWRWPRSFREIGEAARHDA